MEKWTLDWFNIAKESTNFPKHPSQLITDVLLPLSLSFTLKWNYRITQTFSVQCKFTHFPMQFMKNAWPNGLHGWIFNLKYKTCYSGTDLRFTNWRTLNATFWTTLLQSILYWLLIKFWNGFNVKLNKIHLKIITTINIEAITLIRLLNCHLCR